VSRIFPSLAGTAIVLMMITLGVGLSLGELQPQLDRLHDLNASGDESAEIQEEITALEGTKRWANIHRLLGIGTGMMVMLVNCIAVTYFVGTTRWCREVIEAYQLDTTLWGKSASMKRRTFFWAVVGMLTVLVISSLGAMSDPMAAFPNAEQFITPHFLAALLGMGVIGWSFYAQWEHIAANHDIITQVLTDVQRIRKERGIDDDADESETGTGDGPAAI